MVCIFLSPFLDFLREDFQFIEYKNHKRLFQNQFIRGGGIYFENCNFLTKDFAATFIVLLTNILDNIIFYLKRF